MAKQDAIMAKGKVTQALSNGTFNVELENSGHNVYCTLSGNIRKNFIRIMPGDEVDVAISPYDLTKGRITVRHKSNVAPPPAPTHRRYKK